jgi:NDP-sugar pyrophosphorylase family protein
MERIVGIIPAAGKASRFHGVYKELLPIGDGKVLIEHTIDHMVEAGAERVYIITSIDKVRAHQRVIHKDVDFILQAENNDIWSAIKTALPMMGDVNLVAFPDCYISKNPFSLDGDFGLGLFDTRRSERFGVLTEDGTIVNKQSFPDKQRAWGTIQFHRSIGEYWMAHEPADYTDALNQALRIAKTPIHTNIRFYMDVSNFKEYFHLLQYLDYNPLMLLNKFKLLLD